MTTRNPDLAFGPDVRPVPAELGAASLPGRPTSAITPLPASLDNLAAQLGVDATRPEDEPVPDALVKVLVASHTRLLHLKDQVEDRWLKVQEREREIAEREARAIALEQRVRSMEALVPVLSEPRRGWFGKKQ